MQLFAFATFVAAVSAAALQPTGTSSDFQQPGVAAPSGSAMSRPAAFPTMGAAVTCKVPQCSIDPTENACDVSTSCLMTVPEGQQHCACRAGYKADAANDDTTTHYRSHFDGQEFRVFVKPGVVCDTLCDDWMLGNGACMEVAQIEGCN